MPITLILLITGYIMGSLSSAIIVAKLAGLGDPRTQGSGNPGATNILRLGSKRLAALVLLGFIRLSAPSRYVGLALLFITVVKVLAVDMQTVAQIWRVLSLIVSGLLLIATSMAYAKLTPGLLRSRSDSRAKEAGVAGG
jgi:acyl phosphate:glycerol-3-phosphate acyltransferase